MADRGQERDAFLMGQVHALKQIVGALALALPDRAPLLMHLEKTSQSGLADLENQPISDQAIRGFQSIAVEFRTFVEGTL